MRSASFTFILASTLSIPLSYGLPTRMVERGNPLDLPDVSLLNGNSVLDGAGSNNTVDNIGNGNGQNSGLNGAGSNAGSNNANSAGSGNECNGNGAASGNGAGNAVSGTIGGLIGDATRSSDDMLAGIGDTSLTLADTAAGMAKDAEGTVVEIVKLVGDDAAKLARPK